MEDLFRSQFRLPHDLAEKLREAANSAGRSMNAEVVHRLQASFAANDAGGPPPSRRRPSVEVQWAPGEGELVANDPAERMERHLRRQAAHRDHLMAKLSSSQGLLQHLHHLLLSATVDGLSGEEVDRLRAEHAEAVRDHARIRAELDQVIRALDKAGAW